MTDPRSMAATGALLRARSLAALILGLGLLAVAGPATPAPPMTDPAGLPAWLDAHGAAGAAFGVLRVWAVVAGGALALVLLASIVAEAAGWARAAASLDRALPAPLRQKVGVAALLMGVVTAPLRVGAAPAPAGPPPTMVEIVGSAVAPVMHAVDPPPAGPATSDPAPATWTVAPGESFWSISRDLAAERLGREPTDAEVVPGWVALIAANRDLLPTPDPDLLFAGMDLDVPPVAATGVDYDS